jgi:hypothetical protein
MHNAFDPSLVSFLLHISLILRVFQVGHRYKLGVIMTAAVFFKQLNRENGVQPGVLVGQRESTCLASNLLKHSERTNPARTQFATLQLEVFGR